MDTNPLVFLNGAFIPLDQAHISVLDRGFLFGDGVYEVVPVFAGRPFRLQQHLQRLDRSLNKIHLPPPLTHTRWNEIIQRLIPDAKDYAVYIQVTRGAAGLREHTIPDAASATVFAMCTTTPPSQNDISGVSAITTADTRWHNCDIKAITLLANILLRHQAHTEHSAEAIMIRDGCVTEGAASNVFIVSNGVLITPPKSSDLLPGITRDLVLELAIKHRIPVQESPVGLDSLKQAEEIWLTSSTKEILPVIRLDGQAVGSGEIGPHWRAMHALYQAFKQALHRS